MQFFSVQSDCLNGRHAWDPRIYPMYLWKSCCKTYSPLLYSFCIWPIFARRKDNHHESTASVLSRHLPHSCRRPGQRGGRTRPLATCEAFAFAGIPFHPCGEGTFLLRYFVLFRYRLVYPLHPACFHSFVACSL